MDPTVRTRGTRFGAFEVDLRSGELHKHGIRLKLQDQPFRVLALLLERPGEVVTRDELRQELWPADTFVDFDTGLNSAIKKLRDVLADSAEEPRYIETLPRRGYRFIAEIKNGTPGRGAQASSEAAGASESPIGTSLVASHAERASPRLPFRKILKLSLAGLTLCAILLTVALRTSTWRKSRTGGAPARVQSIAVLPLENLSGDPSQEYFADGMTEALITKLAGIKSLRVISRTSTMLYKGTHKALPEIARELNVDAVMEGTVARNNDQVKISAQLIYAPTDSHLWSATFSGPTRDVLELEDKVASDVTAQIRDNLNLAERDGPPKAWTANPEAYDAYLRGVYALNKQTPDDMRMAIRYFQEAIEKDKGFAVAYARLSFAYSMLSTLSEMPSAETYQPAKLAAQKAVALDDSLDQAHIAVAYVHVYYEWDWGGAEGEYKRTLQLNPNSAVAHMSYASMLQILGRTRESLEEERAAKMLDPLSVNTLSYSAMNSYFRREYDKGLAQTREAQAHYPGISAFHTYLSDFYAAQGQDKLSAAEILLDEESGGASPERVAALKAANESSGPRGLRLKRIELNKKAAGKESSNAYDIAIDYAAVGNTDEALVWLERAFQVRDSKMPLIGVEPIFDGLRSNRHFTQLLRQMRLPTPQS
jgi:TolB-like protein/DNA-binding winged helix-turn-helix (wHTH) protein